MFGSPSITNHQFVFREISAGDFPVRSEPCTVLAGQVLDYGSVVGKIVGGANDGKIVLSVAAATDGSQVPVGILAFPVDATAGDTAADYFRSGDYDAGALIYGAGHTAATVKAAFGNAPIFLKNTLGAVEIA